jgi:hypothetical protein
VLEVRSYGKERFNLGQIQNNGKLSLAFGILDCIDYSFALNCVTEPPPSVDFFRYMS